MNLTAPKKEALYCLLTQDAKQGLTQLAKYHNTTLTNLIEEGAHMVIRSHLKQITSRNYNTQSLSTLSDW